MVVHNDIGNRQDIQTLVDRFYERVQADTLLAPLFSHLDWSKHLPVMYNFWSSLMLGDQSYKGNPFQKHINLPIDEEHFTRWLKLFTEVVDENFKGEKADEVKSRARDIAQLFQHKINLSKQVP
jgi:hemoglobin